MDTRERQMKMWSDLLLNYARNSKIYGISLGELHALPLCNNTKINRRLSIESIRAITDWMQKN